MLTKPLVAGDVFIRENFLSRGYDADSIMVIGSSAEIFIPVGTPLLANGAPASSFDTPADFIGFLLESFMSPANSSAIRVMPYLAKGKGVVVVKEMLPLTDWLTISWADIISDEMIVRGFEVRNQPASVQGPQVK